MPDCSFAQVATLHVEPFLSSTCDAEQEITLAMAAARSPSVGSYAGESCPFNMSCITITELMRARTPHGPFLPCTRPSLPSTALPLVFLLSVVQHVGSGPMERTHKRRQLPKSRTPKSDASMPLEASHLPTLPCTRPAMIRSLPLLLQPQLLLLLRRRRRRRHRRRNTTRPPSPCCRLPFPCTLPLSPRRHP